MTYTQLEEEPGYAIENHAPEDWPQAGGMELQDVSLEYYPGAATVLNNVSFIVNPREKIGIAGRTGAGKSSIVSALFRMPDPLGSILIDKINIKSLNIQDSRRAMAVIAQDPVLFTGPLRFNLDPFDHHSDEEIWEALDGASLRSTIENLPEKLDQKLMECGVNLSAGERQLLCLARALLQKSKIIVMDEATANVDYKTDSLIQETIRTKLKECTVITIAHRLNTIMDYDKILVLENGRLVEFDTPQNLLAKANGVLRQLYQSHMQQIS
jgi:ABC-type multidrug transport system fused ATPase/permease subunit